MFCKFFLLTFVAVFGPTVSLYQNYSHVVTLTTEDFDRTILDSHDIWIVQFYAKWCGHCQQFSKDYKKVSRALRPHVKFAAVNGNQDKKLANRFKVEEFPTIFIFGFDKEKPKKVREESRNMYGLINLGLDALKEKVHEMLKPRLVKNMNVVELYDDNFYESVICSPIPWLVYFYGHDCFNCHEDAKTLIKASHELRGLAKIGAMDMEANKLLAAYNKGGLRYFPYDRKSSINMLTYDSKMTVDDISEWVMATLEKEKNEPHLYQIVDEKLLKDSCEHKPMCVIGFLPKVDVCNVECRGDHLKVIKEVAKEFTGENWGWVWTPKDLQPGIETALKIEEIGYPSVVVVDVANKNYYNLSATLTQESLSKFFQGIINQTSEANKITAKNFPTIEYAKFWCDVRDMLEEREDELNEIKEEL